MVNIKARTKSFFGQIPRKIRQVKFLLLTPTRALIVTLLHTRRRRRKAKQYHAISCKILALYSKYFLSCNMSERTFVHRKPFVF